MAGVTVDFRAKGPSGKWAISPLAGDVYRREAGGKRWRKLCKAAGVVTLEPGSQYRLKLRGTVYGSGHAIELLQPIACDAFAEIEVPLRVSRKDVMDQATSGVFWLDRLVEAEAVKIQAALGTSASIITKASAR